MEDYIQNEKTGEEDPDKGKGPGKTTKPDKKGSCVKSWMKRGLLRHPFWILVISAIIMVLMPFALICGMKKWNNVNFDWFRLHDGINVWFAFWGSYIGAIATVLLSIGAMYLSAKYEEINEQNNDIQQALSFHNLRISHIILYDLHDSYPLKELDQVGGKGRFLLKVQFCDPFAPYFTIESFCLKWGNSENEIQTLKVIGSAVINNKKMDMYFLIDPSSELVNDINFFYHINYYEVQIMSLEERRRWMEISFTCRNEMYPESAAMVSDGNSDINLELKICVENKDCYKEKFVDLTVCNRKLKLQKNKPQKSKPQKAGNRKQEQG